MIHARWRKIGSHVLTVFANDLEVCGSAIGVEVDAAVTVSGGEVKVKTFPY